MDSTFIESPLSTKNKEKKRDPEARSAKKGNTWHFGYKAHVGVDKESGLVHTVKATPANEHDVIVMSELLHGEEECAYGNGISMHPSFIKKLSKSGQYAAKKKEHQKSSVRCKVEHVFAVIKNIFRYRKTRYRGLRKQTAKLNIMFALANLYLADRKSLTV